MEKTFADGRKIAKFVNLFSLESFPLYGISYNTIVKTITYAWLQNMIPNPVRELSVLYLILHFTATESPKKELQSLIQ